MKIVKFLFNQPNRKSAWCQTIKSQFSTCGTNLTSLQGGPPKRVCIVGAGPAGFYAAQFILKHLSDCVVDVLEKLPVPFGLVRFGVAPDHPEVKNVINTFRKTASNDRFRFFGNITLGEDVSLQQLRDSYHAVLLTYGADKDRNLNIPNEDQANVLSARQFVAWYNGLPGADQFVPDLSKASATIVGQGNVAVDVARMLLSSIDALRHTDTTEYALEALSRSKIERVYLVGRRGPLQAAFTIKELREMLKLPNVQTIWKPEDFHDVPAQLASLERPRKRLTELMLKSVREQSKVHDKKQFLPLFCRAPKQIVASELECSVTRLEQSNAIITAETERLPGELIFRSIGYLSTCADQSICFDEKSGRVHNENGRIYAGTDKRSLAKGLYVAGWLGSGPVGVILNTMNGAFAVAKSICDDIATQQLDTSAAKSGVELKHKRVVDWQGWERIDKAEIEAGKNNNKPREKIVNIEKMLQIAGV